MGHPRGAWHCVYVTSPHGDPAWQRGFEEVEAQGSVTCPQAPALPGSGRGEEWTASLWEERLGPATPGSRRGPGAQRGLGALRG